MDASKKAPDGPRGGRDASPIAKRFKRIEFAGPNVSPVTQTIPVVGKALREQLEEVSGKTRTGTQLATIFPVKFRNEGTPQAEIYPVNAVYQLKEQVRTNDQQKWTQGMMTGFGHGTTWGEILPTTLTPDSATKYGRAIKSVMGGPVKTSDLGDYVAPDTREVHKRSGEVVIERNAPGKKRELNEGAAKSEAFRFMSPAVTSFVEDLTGRHAANTLHTGSAVRATFLRAKLALGNDASTRTADDNAMLSDFKGYLSGHLTQLKKDGAANLADMVSDEHKRTGGSATADNYQQTTANLHQELFRTIDNTFERKKAKFEAKWQKYTDDKKMDHGAASARIEQKLGKWWGEQARTKAAVGNADLDAYHEHKYARYGIGPIK
ncbi:hypothetical protein [Chitinolyticbacter albus]|uniref:hypothetical protein n=1 Tax=Chitinolyticbacter albus TaxID=2961951 RepID=UPI00210C0481|nr:hypothetical protein [Chitinolyticbacter albus]